MIIKTVFNLICLLYSFAAFANDASPFINKDGKIVITNETIKEYKKINKIKYDGIKEYVLLPLKSLSFSSVQKLCKPILSSEGLLVNEKRQNSILVYDYPQVIKKIKALLKVVDITPERIKIEIIKKANSFNKRKKNRFNKNLPMNQTDSSSNNAIQYIIIQSGNEGKIFSGVEISVPKFYELMEHYKPNLYVDLDEFETKKIGVMMTVSATSLPDNLIQIKLYPKFTSVDKDNKISYIKIEALSTSITVYNGRLVKIGGLMKNKEDEYRNIFDNDTDFSGKSNTNSIMDISIRATIMKRR